MTSPSPKAAAVAIGSRRHVRRRRLGLPVLAVLTVVCAFFASVSMSAGAKGGDSFFGTQGSLGGQFEGPRDVAVNEATDDVYVVDDENHRVQRFDADGDFELAWGWDVVSNDAQTVFEICTVAADCKAGDEGTSGDGEPGRFGNPQGIAVDQTSGDVYVWDRDKSRIQKFDANGNFILMFGDGVNQTTSGDVCTAASGDTCTVGVSGSGPVQLGATFATPTLAVHPGTGDVFVADPGNQLVQQFQSTGAFVKTIGSAAVFNTDAPTSVAVDSTGIVYIGGRAGFGGEPVQRYDLGTDAFLAPIEVAPEGPMRNAAVPGMEVDPATDNLHILEDEPDPTADTVIQELDTPAQPNTVVDTHMEGSGDFFVWGLGLNSGADLLYVTSSQGGHRVLILDEDGAEPPPSATISPATDVEAHSATLSGSVNPNGPAGIPTSYHFEYSKNGVDWTPTGPDTDIGDGTSEVPVSEAVTGLEANTFYRVRLVATKAFGGGSATSPEITLLTDAVAPEVVTGTTQHRTPTSAQLLGTINPNNLPTTYYFEYGRTMAYGSKAPVPDGDAGSGGVANSIVQQIGGLTPDRLYHYRLVATNSQGTTEGVDRTFTTRSTAIVPPDADRAYEMVTPPLKNNRRIDEAVEREAPNPGTPSPDGEDYLFALLNGILEEGGDTAFPHQKDVVVIRRTDDGWESDTVQNTQSQIGASGSLNEISAVSADFGTQAWWHTAYLFPSESRYGTKLMGDIGGLNASGWYDWLGSPVGVPGNSNGFDAALIADDGSRMLRWGGLSNSYRGLMGPSDPSLAQVDGDALYLQSPAATGGRELVNECTGTVAGADATQIVARVGTGAATDTFGAQNCEDNSVTSTRGAIAGAGRGNTADSTALVGSAANAMSNDGKRIFFTSPDPGVTGLGQATCATAVPPGVPGTGVNTMCPSQLFVRQYNSAGNPTVRWISRPTLAGQRIAKIGRGAGFEGASDDGQVVYFKTNAKLMSTDPDAGAAATVAASPNSWDLYRYELPADINVDPAGGTLSRVTAGPSGSADPNVYAGSGNASSLRYLSDDGDRAYFATRAPMAGADATPPEGGVTTPGGTVTNNASRNLYLYDDNQTGSDRWKFIAQISANAGIDRCSSLHPVPGGSQEYNRTSNSKPLQWTPASCVRGTPDGRALAFVTKSQLTEDDTDSAADIYLYDAATDELTRVSAPPPGEPDYVCSEDDTLTPLESCNADLGFDGPLWRNGAQGVDGLRHSNLAIDGDGQLALYFESRLRLVPGDTNGAGMDVYEWKGGELTLMSPGQTTDNAYYAGNSLDGEDVFIRTTQRIDPREVEDRDADIYDARLGGGFPLPPAGPAPCNAVDDGCQGPGAAGTGTSPRTDLPGGGNASPGARQILEIRGLSRKARRKAAVTGLIPLRVTVAKPGMVRATGKARLGRKRQTVAHTAKRAGKAGTVKVKLRLSRAAKRRLGSGRALRLQVKVTASGARPQSVTLVLRRAGR